MKNFHDVEIYAGKVVATTGSRLELGAKNQFLRDIFCSLSDCSGCKEPLALIFPDEEENTLRAAFDSLSHFSTAGFSIIESKSQGDPTNIIILSLILTRSRESDLSAGLAEDPGG